MPTRNISLTVEQDRSIEQVKLKALRAAIQLGLDSIKRGEVDEIDDSDIGGYLRALTAGGRKRSR
jgi:hypothetical protein